MKNKKKLLQLLISIIILLVLILSIDFDGLSQISFQGSPAIVLGIFGLLILSLGSRALRWQIIFNSKKESQRFSFLFSFRYLLIGSALNLIAPASSGDVFKSYYIFKDTGVKEHAVAVSIYDKLIAIASIGFLGVYAFVQSSSILYLIAAIASLMPLAIIEGFVFFRDSEYATRILSFVDLKLKKIDLYKILGYMSYSLEIKTISLIISLFGWICTYILLFLCFRTVGIDTLNVETFLMEGSILTVGRLFPFTLNGIGSDEALMVFLFLKYDILSGLILSGAIIYRLIVIFVPALFGIFLIQKTKQ